MVSVSVSFIVMKVIFLAFCNHTVAHTFTVMTIFKPVRLWLFAKIERRAIRVARKKGRHVYDMDKWMMIKELLSCPYCFGHHVALWTVLLVNPMGNLFISYSPANPVLYWTCLIINYGISWFAMVGMTNYLTYILNRIKAPRRESNTPPEIVIYKTEQRYHEN